MSGTGLSLRDWGRHQSLQCWYLVPRPPAGRPGRPVLRQVRLDDILGPNPTPQEYSSATRGSGAGLGESRPGASRF